MPCVRILGFHFRSIWKIAKEQQQQQFEAKGQVGGGIRRNANVDAKVSAGEALGTRLSRALLAALLVASRALLAALLVAGDAAAASAVAALLGALRG